LRRIPLDDRLGLQVKLTSLRTASSRYLRAGQPRAGELRAGELRPGELRAGELRAGRLGRRGRTVAAAGAVVALAGLGGVTATAVTSAPASPATSPGRSARAAVSVQFASGASLHQAAAAAAVRHASVAGHRPARSADPGHPKPAARRAAGVRPPQLVPHGRSKSWKQVRDELAATMTPHADPGKLPLADRLVTGPASGPQSDLPVTSSRLANATVIVRQALDRRMGLRAAVIAVATAMQESGLENINYGDRDSLGLFQQRPSMGWGSAAQVTTPSYAADAFLRALAARQKTDPGWAGQPLWKTAQSVQNSGFPYAYAKWETQAAQLVSTIATKLS
jgi:hypothetical protein